jgi:hypothetical protein
MFFGPFSEESEVRTFDAPYRGFQEIDLRFLAEVLLYMGIIIIIYIYVHIIIIIVTIITIITIIIIAIIIIIYMYISSSSSSLYIYICTYEQDDERPHNFRGSRSFLFGKKNLLGN